MPPFYFGAYPLGHNVRIQAMTDFLLSTFGQRPHGRAFPAAANSTWRHPGLPFLGVGGQGLAHIWVCVDDTTQVIRDRVVIKHVVPGRAWYNDVRNWFNGVPREYHMSHLLRQQLAPDDRKYCVEYLAFGDVRGTPEWTFKLYIEYCPYGDVEGIVDAQNKPRGKMLGSSSGHRKLERHPANDIPFPESFIWYFFEALAVALVAMDQVGMVHGDLQAGNVLFGNPEKDQYIIWPVPKMHDFGSSQDLNALNAANPNANRTGLDILIHQQYAPPELSFAGGGGWQVQNVEITRTTNVWQAAMLVLCMMKSESPVSEVWHRAGNLVAVPQQLDFTNIAQRDLNNVRCHPNSNYSQNLKDLVQRCMRFDATLRPTPQQLLADIRRHMDVKGVDTFEWPKKKSSRQHRERIGAIPPAPRQDRFRIGKKWK